MEDKINKIWYQMNMKEITSEEARQQVLDLFAVIQRSEQLFCECPNNFDICQETKVYHTGCNKEVKVIRTK